VTTSTDMAGHPDVTEISDLAEGLLSPARSATVQEHLDVCSSCVDVLESLEEIRNLLGALPTPSAMPADIAKRIDAALADEEPPQAREQAAAENGPDDEASDVSRETSLPASSSRPSGHPRASTGPGRKDRMIPERKPSGRPGPAHPTPDRSARARRRAMALGTVCTVAVLGVGVLLSQSLTGGDGAADKASSTTVSDSFSGERLDTQVDALLTPAQKDTSNSPMIDSGSDTRGTTGTNSLRMSVLPECVRAGLRGSDKALAAKPGTYQGKKAYLVVLPDPSDDAHVTAYVVDGTCVDQPAVGPGKVLVKHSYARP
jgi:hypothetical protein